jgi:DNA ligase D-like protein (predicted ligase)
MNWEKVLSNKEKGQLKKTEQKKHLKPMLAKLTHDYFSDENWIYERKLDGERCLCFKKGAEVKLISRNNKSLNETYPELIEALKRQSGNFIVDGEIVAFKGNVTDFSKLQNRMHKKKGNGNVKIYYYLFDILHADDYQTENLPLRSRKKVLKKYLSFDHDLIRYLPHKNTKGEEFREEACQKNWEGIIAKDARSEYIHNRSSKWLKFKCENRQEFIILGYTDPTGERIGFGALLLGYYEDNELRYAGKVGTGFDDETLEFLIEKMKPLQNNNPEIKDKPDEKNAHFIKPKLVCEVHFTEWTTDGKLRHPAYKGLRDDKAPEKVVREDR